MTIIARKIPSSVFTYDAKTKTFCTEMSIIRDFSQIYDDACDRGFSIVSAKTGAEVTFAVCENETDWSHGELQSWTLRPITEHVFYNPKLRDLKVIVFND